MDEIDNKILGTLEKNSRKSNIEIAKELNLSEGTIRRRIQKLLENKIIHRFTIDRSPASSFIAFSLIETLPEVASNDLILKIKKISRVRKVFELAGKIDFLVEIHANSSQEFNEIIDEVRKIHGVKDTESLVVLRIN